jgi:serine protease
MIQFRTPDSRLAESDLFVRALFCLGLICGYLTSSTLHAAVNDPNAKPFKTVCEIGDDAARVKFDEQTRTSLRLGSALPFPAISPPITGPIVSQPPKPRKPHQKLKDFAFKKEFHAGIVDIKFVEGADITIEGGLLRSGNKKIDLAQINDVIAKHGMMVRPLFTRPPAELKAEKACGERREGEELDDLTLWFELDITSTFKIDIGFGLLNSLMHRLNNLGDIEYLAFRSKAFIPPRSDIPPISNSLISYQSHLKSALQAVTGIDADYAHSLGASGKGQGVKVILVGGSVRLTHEDLNDPFIPALMHMQWNSSNTALLPSVISDRDTNHDTGALGIIMADADNGIGVRGVSPYAGFSFVSTDHTGSHNPANAVNVAAGRSLAAGDVIVLEFGWCRYLDPINEPGNIPYAAAVGSGNSYKQYVDTFGRTVYAYACLPPDEDPPRFVAIKNATSNGVIVVSTAHNSDVDLDHPVFNGRYDPLHPLFDDSGAILVGSKSLIGQKYIDSNFGRRIDASAQGESIATIASYCSDAFCASLSTQNSDPDQRYTTTFGGTSGAGPIVAGASVVLQALQKARNGPVIPPKVMRKLFRTIGTPQVAPTNKAVGRTPDLKALWQWMIADDDGDGLLNIDELIAGRSPYLDERKLLPLLLGDD